MRYDESLTSVYVFDCRLSCIQPSQSFDTTRSSSENIFIDNVDRIVDNPLAHWLPSEIRKYARQFAEDRGLKPQTDLLVKVCSRKNV